MDTSQVRFPAPRRELLQAHPEFTVAGPAPFLGLTVAPACLRRAVGRPTPAPLPQGFKKKKSPNQITPHKGGDVPLFCLSVSPKCLEKCLAYKRCSIDTHRVGSCCFSGGATLYLEKSPTLLSRPTRPNTIQPYPPCPLPPAPSSL